MRVTRLNRITERDIKEMEQLFAELHNVPTFEIMPARAVAAVAKNEIYVVRDGDQIVGMAMLVLIFKISKTVARIEDFVVRNDSRRRGIGKAIVDRVVAEARDLGAERIDLQSNEKRIAAHVFYEACGFERKSSRVYRKSL